MNAAAACILFIGGSGWVTAFVALRAEQKQFVQRCRADRIARAYQLSRKAIMRGRAEAEAAAVSSRALADDRGEAITQLEADVAELSSALCNISLDAARGDGYITRLVDAFCTVSQNLRAVKRELADLKAHPGRAMRALQLAQARPPATEARLALDPVWRQAHPDQVAA